MLILLKSLQILSIGQSLIFPCNGKTQQSDDYYFPHAVNIIKL
jgi:hypothetical protein